MSNSKKIQKIKLEKTEQTKTNKKQLKSQSKHQVVEQIMVSTPESNDYKLNCTSSTTPQDSEGSSGSSKDQSGEKIKEEPLLPQLSNFESEELEQYREFIYEQIRLEREYYTMNNYFSRQVQIRPQMRAMLIDWMIEVSSFFIHKRETLYLALSYLDRFLKSCHTVSTQYLQLLGITSLFIAQKMEELNPFPVSDFQQTTDNCYSVTQMLKAELCIFQTLEYRMNSVTPMFWMNLFTSQWDDFVRQYSNLNIKFIFRDSYACEAYKEICQIMDSVYTDYGFFDKNPRLIILSLIFLIIGKYMNFFTNEEITSKIISDASFMKRDEKIPLNYLFSLFIKEKLIFTTEYVKPTLESLIPYVQFVAKYFLLKTVQKTPQIKPDQPIHREDYINIQIHNQNSLPMIKIFILQTEQNNNNSNSKMC